MEKYRGEQPFNEEDSKPADESLSETASRKQKRKRRSQVAEYKRDPEIVTVRTGDKGEAEAPDIFEMEGLGPCIGVIIHDKKTRKAIGEHLIDPRSMLAKVNKSRLEALLDEAIARSGGKKNLRIYAGGGGMIEISPDPEVTQAIKEHNEEVPKKRKFVEDTFKRYGFRKNQIKLTWIDSTAEDLKMSVDLGNGEVEFDILTMNEEE